MWPRYHSSVQDILLVHTKGTGTWIAPIKGKRLIRHELVWGLTPDAPPPVTLFLCCSQCFLLPLGKQSASAVVMFLPWKSVLHHCRFAAIQFTVPVAMVLPTHVCHCNNRIEMKWQSGNLSLESWQHWTAPGSMQCTVVLVLHLNCFLIH